MQILHTYTHKHKHWNCDVMLVTGCQQPCQDQPDPQSGPWSLPLVPQTQWPNLFECEKKTQTSVRDLFGFCNYSTKIH